MPYKDPAKRRENYKIYHANNKDKLNKLERTYYHKNLEKNKERARKYYLVHKKEKTLYYLKNINKKKLYNNKYRIKNIDYLKEKDKQYYLEHKQELKEYKKIYNLKNKIRIAARNKEYKQKNKNKLSQQIKMKYHNDLNFRIKTLVRTRLVKALQHNSKYKKTNELIGCTIPFLKQYLEKQFKPGMTWDKIGVKGIHIDHIRPCALFDLSDPKQQKQCFHYTNLQPLWAKENLSKGDKYIENNNSNIPLKRCRNK